MIFVTVGTHYQAFDRLMNALDSLDPDLLVVQRGHSKSPRAARTSVDFMPLSEMLKHLNEAETVITHAGVGSILLSVRAGHTPLTIPRLRRYGEHVDDHQVEFTHALADEGNVVPVWDVDDLASAVRNGPARVAPRPPEVGPLHRAVRAALG